MVQRLAQNRRERATMLAGIAHDLRAPITRLQFRLSMPQLSADERERCAGDLQSLERITGQFLLFAGGGDSETSVEVPLDQLLAEVASSHPADQLQLQLVSIGLSVKPVALGRAVANLIDNAFSYGAAPVTLKLHAIEDRCCIEVWDQGEGMAQQWTEACNRFIAWILPEASKVIAALAWRSLPMSPVSMAANWSVCTRNLAVRLQARLPFASACLCRCASQRSGHRKSEKNRRTRSLHASRPSNGERNHRRPWVRSTKPRTRNTAVSKKRRGEGFRSCS